MNVQIKLFGCLNRLMKHFNFFILIQFLFCLCSANEGDAAVNVLTPEVYDKITEQFDLSNRNIKKYKQLFGYIEKADFEKVDKLISKLDNQILLGHVLAEKYLHAKYKTSCEELVDWLLSYEDFPQAKRLYRLSKRKKCAYIQSEKNLESEVDETKKISLKYLEKLNAGDRNFLVKQSKKFRSYIAKGKTLPARQILENKRFQKLAPKPYWDGLAATLALKYLVDNYDKKALEWGIKASKRHNSGTATWVAGLASWKLKNYKKAASYFARLGNSKNSDEWLVAAGAFWAARAYEKTGNSLKAQEMLKQAVKYKYTFYGILAAYKLSGNLDFAFDDDSYINDFDTYDYIDEITQSEAMVRFLLLIEIEQKELAEKEIWNVYESLSDKQKEAVILIATQEGMHSLVIAIARSKREALPAGKYDKELYPLPKWYEEQDLKVDEALVLALIRQESAFKDNATSRAGARGLMQLMPNTAYHVSGDKSVKQNKDKLLNPEYNLQLGQMYVDYLLNKPFIEGNLFYMLTAYNGGPTNLVKWQKNAKYGGDPLLFIEVIPAAETRIYIERVMANYWIYNLRFGKPNKTLEQIADGKWPVIEREE